MCHQSSNVHFAGELLIVEGSMSVIGGDIELTGGFVSYVVTWARVKLRCNGIIEEVL